MTESDIRELGDFLVEKNPKLRGDYSPRNRFGHFLRAGPGGFGDYADIPSSATEVTPVEIVSAVVRATGWNLKHVELMRWSQPMLPELLGSKADAQYRGAGFWRDLRAVTDTGFAALLQGRHADKIDGLLMSGRIKDTDWHRLLELIDRILLADLKEELARRFGCGNSDVHFDTALFDGLRWTIRYLLAARLVDDQPMAYDLQAVADLFPRAFPIGTLNNGTLLAIVY